MISGLISKEEEEEEEEEEMDIEDEGEREVGGSMAEYNRGCYSPDYTK